ncbi:hypothetical protein [Xenorhabdus sp. KK7.4]|uniref:hypothetical protein n=1 Tax=Xenorhabdus sp. KK7.4 TaxID=1851572 RepID=UPI000C03F623|nr:hypothetical protein [Xenorhabdus sp. KK7.4]PHM47738.1 hypothetical protein Xekk_04494 [Xenorhabdus sp. KK7.4]
MGSVDGIYISKDHTLTITDSVDKLATFSGSFISNNLLTGGVHYDQISGQYRFAADAQAWPAQISFFAILAPIPPASRKHVIADYWNGIRTADGSIIMSGVRTYTTDEGIYDIYTFEKVIFTLTPTEA